MTILLDRLYLFAKYVNVRNIRTCLVHDYLSQLELIIRVADSYLQRSKAHVIFCSSKECIGYTKVIIFQAITFAAAVKQTVTTIISE